MIETNEQKIARKEIKAAIENLLQACRNNNAAFCGFAWGINPMFLIRFGNVKEDGPDFTALLLKLEDLTNEKKDAGLVMKDPLSEPTENN